MGRKAAFRHPRYRILRLIAEGGMGKVYLARDLLEEGREVALKVYPALYHHEQLRREFLALKELHHPGIARAFHFGLAGADSAPFFTLEHVHGLPLDRHLAREPARGKLAAALELFLESASAVAYLHRRGVLHLDLKPENILVVEGKAGLPARPVIIDFGLVRARSGPARHLGHATLPYAPPEAFTGEAPAPASDVYSLAAAFYRALSGRLPVDGRDFESLGRAHRSGAALPIPEAPPELGRVLLRALAKDPRRRFADAGAFHRALAHAAESLSGDARRRSRRGVAFHEPDFVGRVHQVEELERWLDSGTASRPVFEVIGGSGWGKTRFLEKAEALIEMKGRGAIHVRESALHARGLFPSIDLAASVLSERQASRGRQAGKMQGRDGKDGAATQERVLQKLVPLLRAGSFLLIDGVGAATPAERSLLGRAASMLRAGSPVAGGIVVSRAPEDGPVNPGEQQLAGARVSSVELGPLELEEALQIDLEGLDGSLSELPPERVRGLKTKLHQQSGGHPLFFVRGLLDLAGDPEGALGVAPTDRILARVKQLESLDRSFAAALALIERPSRVADVAGALEIESGKASAAAGRLRNGGLIACSGDAVRIIHESVASALIESLPRSDVVAMHLRIAGWLLENSPAESSVEAAWHFLEAGKPRLGVAAVECWLSSGSPLRAALGKRAVDALRGASRAAGQESILASRILEAASDVLEAMGRFEECAAERTRLLKRTRKSATRRTEDDVRRQRKLGAVLHRVGKLELALESLQACISPEAARASSVESLRARADLALLHHFRGETDRALEHSQRGVESWLGSSAAVRKATIQSAVNFHAVLGQVRIRRLELGEATEILQRGVQLARKSSSPSNTALLLNNLGLAHHLSGRLETALATFEQAESIARQLEDPAALVSVRSNLAQIHSRRGRFVAARALLDELEDSSAVSQSKRLRLGCLYTRALFLSLLGSDTIDPWSQVEELAVDAGDAFLARFARIYRAEGLIGAGALQEARSLLAHESDPLLERPAAARLAYLEALARDEASARAALKSLAGARHSPPLLEAANGVFSSLAHLELGDFSTAIARVEAERGFYRSMGAAVGDVECSLVLADARLRSAHGEDGELAAQTLRAAARDIEAARGTKLEAPSDVSPRSRDLRATVLEARLAIEKLARLERRGDGSGKDPGERSTLRGEIRDLLARASGDSALASAPSLQTLVECLHVAAARLDGELDVARSHSTRLRALHEGVAGLLGTRDRRRFLAVDPWSRFHLQRFSPPEGDRKLEARHADALASILACLEPPGGSAANGGLAPALEAIARGAGADRVFLEREDGAGWITEQFPEPPVRKPESGDGAARSACGSVLCASLRFQGAAVGRLRASKATGDGFDARTEAFVDAAVRAIAPYFAQRPSAMGAELRGPGASSPTRALGAASGETARPGKRQAPVATSALERTHRIHEAASRTGALARVFRSEGMQASGRDMTKVMRACAAFAATDLPVLITGESGTGKNLVARVLHRLSARASSPIVAQSASAIPPELFEADLFGYERGAFTGAESARTGFLFQAAGGTFHLEEIGDLDLALQQRLLKVIEERSVRPLGSTSVRRLDVRFVASTQRDLEAMMRRGEFRKDLYYRLCGARIHLPSLSERKDALPDLVEHIWHDLTGEPMRFAPAALEALRSHDWPGNVRELVSVLRRLSIDATGPPAPADVRAALGKRQPRGLLPPGIFQSRSFEDVTHALEESYLAHLHEKHAGSVEAIAAALGTTTRSIYRRFERLGLKPTDLREKS